MSLRFCADSADWPVFITHSANTTQRVQSSAGLQEHRYGATSPCQHHGSPRVLTDAWLFVHGHLQPLDLSELLLPVLLHPSSPLLLFGFCTFFFLVRWIVVAVNTGKHYVGEARQLAFVHNSRTDQRPKTVHRC